MKKSAVDLQSLGEKRSPADLQHAFLSGLSQAFSQMKMMVPMMQPQAFESVVQMAAAMEAQMKMAGEHGHEATECLGGEIGGSAGVAGVTLLHRHAPTVTWPCAPG